MGSIMASSRRKYKSTKIKIILHDEVWHRLNNQIRNRVAYLVYNQVSNNVWTKVLNKVWEQTENRMVVIYQMIINQIRETNKE
jgi:hypothetical protein